MFEEVRFPWGVENDEIEVPKKSAETGGNRYGLLFRVNAVIVELTLNGV
jgi:hypothetical protein